MDAHAGIGRALRARRIGTGHYVAQAQSDELASGAFTAATKSRVAVAGVSRHSLQPGTQSERNPGRFSYSLNYLRCSI